MGLHPLAADHPAAAPDPEPPRRRPAPFRISLAATPGCLLLACCLGSAASAATWEDLEGREAVIERIEVRVTDVFDLSDPAEDHLIARAANAVHITSREGVIGRELLFEAGDVVDARLVSESERNLRSLVYLRDARIVPVELPGGGVLALVVAEDAWSLKGGGKFRYEGGDVEWALEAEEVNLLGFGKTLRLGYEQTEERRSSKIAYGDPRLFGSRWRLGAGHEELSDGHRTFLHLARPFFALRTRRAFLAAALDERSSVRLYRFGDEVFRYPADFEYLTLEAWKAVAGGRSSVLRWGLAYRSEEAEYGDPVPAGGGLEPLEAEDRDLKGLFLLGHYLQDRHIVATGMTSIGKTEDVNLGWDVAASAGGYLAGLGADRDAFAARLRVRKHWRVGKVRILKLEAGAAGRLEDEDWKDSRAGLAVTAFDQGWPHQTLVLHGVYDGVFSPAPESVLTIGSSDGLRGYVDEFLTGDRRWLVSVEDRVITDLRLWGIAQLGFVVFADAGAIRRLAGGWSRTYAGVGSGLRIGNLKSAFGRVVLATIAFPLVKGEGVNDFEVFVGNEIPF